MENKPLLIGYTIRNGGKPFSQVDSIFSIYGISPTLVAGLSHGNVCPKILIINNGQ